MTATTPTTPTTPTLGWAKTTEGRWTVYRLMCAGVACGVVRVSDCRTLFFASATSKDGTTATNAWRRPRRLHSALGRHWTCLKLDAMAWVLGVAMA